MGEQGEANKGHKGAEEGAKHSHERANREEASVEAEDRIVLSEEKGGESG